MTEFYRENLMYDLVERFNNFQHFFLHEGAAVPGAGRRVALNALKVGVKLVPKGRVAESLRCLDFAVKMLIETAHPRVPLGAPAEQPGSQ